MLFMWLFSDRAVPREWEYEWGNCGRNKEKSGYGGSAQDGSWVGPEGPEFQKTGQGSWRWARVPEGRDAVLELFLS